MRIGTQYFRPPNPEPEVWDHDLKQIADLGMSLVRCWVYWRHVEPSEGDWAWDDYDRFMNLAGQNNLSENILCVTNCHVRIILSHFPAGYQCEILLCFFLSCRKYQILI